MGLPDECWCVYRHWSIVVILIDVKIVDDLGILDRGRQSRVLIQFFVSLFLNNLKEKDVFKGNDFSTISLPMGDQFSENS